MILTAIIVYAALGFLVGGLNCMVEEGDPGNESDHWLVILRSIGIGIIWLPFAIFAVLPRKDHVLEPKNPGPPSLPAT